MPGMTNSMYIRSLSTETTIMVINPSLGLSRITTKPSSAAKPTTGVTTAQNEQHKRQQRLRTLQCDVLTLPLLQYSQQVAVAAK